MGDKKNAIQGLHEYDNIPINHLPLDLGMVRGDPLTQADALDVLAKKLKLNTQPLNQF